MSESARIVELDPRARFVAIVDKSGALPELRDELRFVALAHPYDLLRTGSPPWNRLRNALLLAGRPGGPLLPADLEIALSGFMTLLFGEWLTLAPHLSELRNLAPRDGRKAVERILAKTDWVPWAIPRLEGNRAWTLEGAAKEAAGNPFETPFDGSTHFLADAYVRVDSNGVPLPPLHAPCRHCLGWKLPGCSPDCGLPGGDCGPRWAGPDIRELALFFARLHGSRGRESGVRGGRPPGARYERSVADLADLFQQTGQMPSRKRIMGRGISGSRVSATRSRIRKKAIGKQNPLED